jgi:plasmid stability protein
MKSLHIRDLDDAVVEGLKRRARRHHRSLQKEVTSLLTDAALMVPPESSPEESPLRRLHVVETGRADSNWSRDELYGDGGR